MVSLLLDLKEIVLVSEVAMNEGTSRQEMALMLVRAMEAMGIDTSKLIDSTSIPDFNQVDS